MIADEHVFKFMASYNIDAERIDVEALRKVLKEGFYAGFMSSGEGYNGEWGGIAVCDREWKSYLKTKQTTVTESESRLTDEVYDKLKQVVYTFTNGNLCESDIFEFINRFIELHEQSKSKPEPVGMFIQKISGCWEYWGRTDEYFDEEVAIPLYRYPPTRDPLSEDDLLNIVEQCTARPQVSHILVARAVEQAHGIGGRS